MDKKVIWVINQTAGKPDSGWGERHFNLATFWVKKGYEVVIISGSYNHLFKNQPKVFQVSKTGKDKTQLMKVFELIRQQDIELQKSLIPAEFFGGQPGEFIPVTFGTKHNMVARSTLSQLIFDGSYIVALQASKTYLKYYENAKVKTNSEIREMVINAYGNVLLAQESISILEKNKRIL